MKLWSTSIQFDVPPRAVFLGGDHLSEALPELLQEREEAGFRRGQTEGERNLGEQLMRQRSELLAVQQGVLDGLRNAMPQVKADCEQALARFAFEVAAKLVAGLPISAAMIEASLREALSQVEEHTDYHIYLNPEDLELLQQINSPALLSNVAGQKIHFHRAPELTRGGCMVKTRFGLIDGSRESKVLLLEKALLS